MSCEIETQLDKISSSLPGDLINNILSYLPIRDAVRTSILSRSWRYKWATVPSLVFDEQCFPIYSLNPTQIENKLISIIDRVLLLHKGPIQKFELSHENLEGIGDIDRWILFISRSFVKELILEIWEGERYKPPSCLFNCQNLTHLELFNCSFKPPSTFKGFKNLKILDLQDTTIDQDVFENLICGCPLLEKLTLNNIDGFIDLNIDAPNLRYIDAWTAFHDVSFKNAYNLTSVSIGFDDEIVKNIHDEPKIDESSNKLLRFFANLPHIQRLDTCMDFLENLACGNIPRSLPNKCLDLKYLSIYIDFDSLDETEAALSLLRSSPNLQELEILSGAETLPDERTYSNLCGDDLWTSLFTHLRVLTLEDISGFRSELDFISFILSNAPALERMTVKPFSDASLGLKKELLRFKRASIDLEIIYMNPDP